MQKVLEQYVADRLKGRDDIDTKEFLLLTPVSIMK